MTNLHDPNSDPSKDQIAEKMRKHAIATLRYKVYIFIMVVILVFAWPYLTSAIDKLRGEGAAGEIFSLGNILTIGSNLLDARGDGGLLANIETKEKEIADVKENIERAKMTNKIIEQLNDKGKQNTIINCLNNNICGDIEPSLEAFFPLFRTYLLIGNLKGQKMRFDQKTILKNINDFLLKTNAGLNNSELLAITFGDTREVSKKFHLHEIPITLTIRFPHQKMLLSFLHNVEEKVSFTIPILYKIDALDYNIVNYAEEQEVKVSLLAYYIDNLDENSQVNGDDISPTDPSSPGSDR